MTVEDRVFQMFAEANPAPLSAMASIERPDADALVATAATRHPQPELVAVRPVRSWRGPVVALASFVVILAAVAGAIWLAGSGERGEDVTTEPPVVTTPAPVVTTQPPVDTSIPPTPTTEAPVVSTAPPTSIVEPDPCTAPASPLPGIGEIGIDVFFECDSDGLYPTGGIAVRRIVPEQGGEAIDRIEWTLRTLLAGPTDEERNVGFNSFFDTTTAEALNGVTLVEGHVVADFNEAIYVNNASTSTGGVFFNAELRSNLFQHPEVESAEFHINGDCEAWSAFFQSDGCWIITRAEWDQQLAEWGDLRTQ